MIDWNHPRFFERLRCFGLCLFAIGVAQHDTQNGSLTIAALIVATLLAIRLKIELEIRRDEERTSLERKLKLIDLINAVGAGPAIYGVMVRRTRFQHCGRSRSLMIPYRETGPIMGRGTIMQVTGDEQVAMRADWVPLEQVLGRELCDQFMCMCRSGEVYLYKHIDIRWYLNLDAQGHCFRYTGKGYEPEERARAVAHVFG
jgi:hypothetical protein